MIKQQPDERWDAILGMLESIAALDFSRTLPISDKADEMDAVASGLNMLSEELHTNVVERSKLARIVTELEVANKELQAFSDALAHDLRNPLLIVTNFSHQLHETLDDSLNEQQKEDLQRIRAAGRHMVHIVDDLRDLADVNRVELTRREVDLSSLAREIIDDLSVLVPDRDVRFEAEPGIMALGDKTLLRILLSNLLQNAWKYTGPSDDAWIELGVVEDEDDVPIYHVRDNGIGFDNADREVIFKAFERLHTRLEFAGSGLGLATVERIVRRHGGQVWGEGVLGEGAVFRFTLGSSSTGQ
jgi:light-regulated signal transduction histidine kinase (bacteriophytochrome)